MEKLILLIDDDEDEFIILQQAVQTSGQDFHCAWADGASKAEHLLTQLVPDLILIDYNMPVTNGIDCLQHIRDMYGMREVPIVMYSTYISRLTQELALTKGATCMLKSDSIVPLTLFLIKFGGGSNNLPAKKNIVSIPRALLNNQQFLQRS